MSFGENEILAAEQNMVIGNSITQREEAIGKWNYETKETLEEALTSVDFIVISILPGTFDEMESDVHIPERLGIYQVLRVYQEMISMSMS